MADNQHAKKAAPVTPTKLSNTKQNSWQASKVTEIYSTQLVSGVNVFDPHRINSKIYTLVHRKDKSSFPGSVKRCKEGKVVFTMADIIAVKTTAIREYTDANGKKQRNAGIVYLHYLANCLKGHDQKFEFASIQVPNKTKSLLSKKQISKLANTGLKFECLQ